MVELMVLSFSHMKEVCVLVIVPLEHPKDRSSGDTIQSSSTSMKDSSDSYIRRIV